MYDPKQISHWHASIDPSPRRPALEGDMTADVVIVGAGYTGLWTAYYLMEQSPDLKIIVLEANFVGFGASGRNGGWCSPALAGLDEWLENPTHHDRALHLQHLMFDAVDEVGRVAQRENIDFDYAKDGELNVATTAAQEKKLKKEYDFVVEQGLGDSVQWLDESATKEFINIQGSRGALYTPQCAVIHPAKLVTGVAATVEKKGVRIYEQSPVTHVEAGRVRTGQGSVTAAQVVIATEAYSAKIDGLSRRLVPVHSQLIVTEPLSDELMARTGLKNRVVFGDGRGLVTYGQRTADNRIAFGYRASYIFGSGIKDVFDADDPSFDGIYQILLSFFPFLKDVQVDQCWGGALGVARDMSAFVHYDAETKLGWAGGYTGNGVAASNLAGRTMADLLLGQDTERLDTPWVRTSGSPLTKFPHWEPEPLRWMGVQGVRTMLRLSDWLGV